MNTASTIWSFFKGKGLNDFAIAGIMGNLYAESALKPNNLQNSYQTKLGYTDEAYTKAVDNGTYTNFVKDSAGYGLAQWTYWSRKQALLEYARYTGKSISDLTMQLEFMWKEMQTYKSMLSTLKSATSVLEASNAVLTQYERPADMSEAAQQKRAAYGQDYYNKHAGVPEDRFCVVVSDHADLNDAKKQIDKLRAAGFSNAYVLEKPTGTLIEFPPDKVEEEQVKVEVSTAKYDPAVVIEVAMGEVGYLEKASNADLDDNTANAGDQNFTKYARDLDKLGFYNGKKNGVAWCDIFTDWCFVKAYGKEAALALTFQPTKAADNCGAGCKYSRQYYQNKGRLFDTPKPGDQIFFYSADKSKISHTGLVYAVDNSYVYTVEGNTSSASGVVDNGGAVSKKKYKLSYERLAGFGRPGYDVEYKEEASSENYILYTVKSGDSLWSLAKRFLGNGEEWPRIAEMNGIKGTLILDGATIKIPS